MIFDGDCRFCTLWIRRWQAVTDDFVEYLPFQNERVAKQFPEMPRDQFENAVQLVLPDGCVFSAAEAVFRSLACNPNEQWLIELYQHSPTFASISETSYRFVARHRTFFSLITRLLWGNHLEPPRENLVRWFFLRGLGIIYLIAFLSLWTQIGGLIGSNGIVPARLTMQSVREQFDEQHVGLDRYHQFPTFCWFDSSEGSLKFQCAAGTVLALLLTIGIAPAPCLFLLWLIYLSLSTVCDVFLGFQWDTLLLETGFLAIFFAPLQMWPRHPAREAPPSRLILWLLRLLLFRLMFESGIVKLLSHDPSWKNLSALSVHYQTQPLPTWIGWYVHQLPASFQKFSCAAMFGIELVLPFFIFLPRKPRQIACAAFVGLELLIFLTGNYCFFNLLTMLLCLLLLDDAAIQKFLPSRFTRLETRNARKALRWPLVFEIPLALAVACACYQHFFAFAGVRSPGPGPVLTASRWLQPLRSFNSYGLFAVMTTSRPEIIIEGSDDGEKWKAYEFKYKPGELNRRPRFVEPHQPRLDWQMWFAALGDVRQNPWFVNFCVRLLQGSPEVLSLLKQNPFSNAPPRYIRAVVYEYQFTDSVTRKQTGNWWRREFKGIYLPPITLTDRQPQLMQRL
jgi:predicted DCC family thiol-disulfide oxidoreductase YuxK